MAIRDLETLLQCPVTGPAFMPGILTDLVAAFAAERMVYIFVGTIACGMYARARYTDVIDVLVARDSPRNVVATLGSLSFMVCHERPHVMSFRHTMCGAKVNVAYAVAPQEQRAIEDAADKIVFGWASASPR